jgi:hypothetical protein
LFYLFNLKEGTLIEAYDLREELRHGLRITLEEEMREEEN